MRGGRRWRSSTCAAERCRERLGSARLSESRGVRASLRPRSSELVHPSGAICQPRERAGLLAAALGCQRDLSAKSIGCIFS